MTSKHSSAGAVALVALASVAQAADLQPVLKAPVAEPPQQATGYVEVYSGWAWTRADANIFPTERFNGWALGGAGRANYWITREVSVQVDAQAEGTSYDDPSGRHFSTHSYLVGGHWSWRDPQQYLFGLFAAAGDAGGSFAQRHGVIGAEAQWYWAQFTLYLQGGYDTTLGTVTSITDSVHAGFIRGTGRYFINPNFMIEATGMYASGDTDFNLGFSQGFQTWSWQTKAEWRFASAPFSIYAKYQGSETKFDTIEVLNEKVRDHRVMLGLKLHMGDKTLQQTDRAGATLDIIDPLGNPTGPLFFGPLGGI